MKNSLKHIIILFILGLLINPMTPIITGTNFFQNVSSKTLFVGGSGPGNYSKIQDAVDNASGGDTIFVFQGIYYETVVIPRQLTILGESKQTTIIDSQKKGYTIWITANNVTISGFTLENGSHSSIIDNDAELYLDASFITIIGNIIRGYDFGIMCGVFAPSKGHNAISKNIISNTSVGISLTGTNNYISQNFITHCSNDGILIFDGNNTISGNIIFSNEVGFEFCNVGENNISGNEFRENYLAIVFSWVEDEELHYRNRNNIIYGNNFRNNTHDEAFAEIKGFCGRNIWRNNYWDKPRILPRPIFGFKQTRFYYETPFGPLWLFIPWFRFDWHPAKKPFPISLDY
jgi:parallel beta-helix repeat protein